MPRRCERGRVTAHVVRLATSLSVHAVTVRQSYDRSTERANQLYPGGRTSGKPSRRQLGGVMRLARRASFSDASCVSL